MKQNQIENITELVAEEDYQTTGHTKEEWMQLVTDATAKNITFIIPE